MERDFAVPRHTFVVVANASGDVDRVGEGVVGRVSIAALRAVVGYFLGACR